MILEKIIVAIFTCVMIAYLSYNYVKKHAPENLLIVMLSAALVIFYITFAILDISIPIYAQIFILLFEILLPLLNCVLQFNDIAISQKIKYWHMKYLYGIREYEKTLKLIDKLILLQGYKNEYLYIAGMCYKNTGNIPKAKDNFVLALEYDNKDASSYYEYGLILDSTNKKEAALMMFDKALKSRPNFYEAQEAKAICLTSQGRILEAIYIYKEAVKVHRNAHEMFYNMGMLECEVEKFDEAEKSFEEVEKIKPDFILASYNVAELAYRRGDYNKAIEKYKKVTPSINYGTKAYYKTALCYARLKDYGKAMSILEYTFELDEEFIKKASTEIALIPMREMLNKYVSDREKLKIEEKEKNNYMSNKVVSFASKSQNVKIAK